MKHEMYLTATYHLVNIPNFLRDIVQKSYEMRQANPQTRE